jgi:hypothetical protein
LGNDLYIKTVISGKEWDDWDRLCIKTKYVSFISQSTWLESFCKLPFIKKQLITISHKNNENDILGGIAGLRINFFILSIYIFPSGPYIFKNSQSEVSYISLLLNYLNNLKGKKYLCTEYSLSQINSKFTLKKWKFVGVYPFPGFGLVKILKPDFEDFLLTLKSTTRRDIRASFRKGIEVKEITDFRDLRLVYNQFKTNAIRNEYKIKPFWWYKKMWEKQLELGVSRFFLAVKDGDIKGAIWVMKGGQMYNYIMGASKREKMDLLVGYRLQAEIIQLSIQEGLSNYNISIGGPKGVEKFKDDFGREKINSTKQYACLF